MFALGVTSIVKETQFKGNFKEAHINKGAFIIAGVSIFLLLL
jgi:hypothetical protein